MDGLIVLAVGGWYCDVETVLWWIERDGELMVGVARDTALLVTKVLLDGQRSRWH